MSSLGIRCGVFIIGFWVLGFGSVSHAVPVVDGYVQGATEGYTSEYNVDVLLDSGETISGNKLFLASDATWVYVGQTFPLTFNDNTYGPNAATDWASSPKGGTSLRSLMEVTSGNEGGYRG